jgi:hypothetical protein
LFCLITPLLSTMFGNVDPVPFILSCLDFTFWYQSFHDGFLASLWCRHKQEKF